MRPDLKILSILISVLTHSTWIVKIIYTSRHIPFARQLEEVCWTSKQRHWPICETQLALWIVHPVTLLVKAGQRYSPQVWIATLDSQQPWQTFLSFWPRRGATCREFPVSFQRCCSCKGIISHGLAGEVNLAASHKLLPRAGQEEQHLWSDKSQESVGFRVHLYDLLISKFIFRSCYKSVLQHSSSGAVFEGQILKISVSVA